jgi:hypothetical protein
MSRAHPASAVLSRPSGPNRNGPGCSARMAAVLASSNQSKLTWLAKLITEQQQFNDRQAVIQNATGEVAFVVAALQAKAEAEEWSERKLAAKVGLPRTTWQRVCSGGVPAPEWLPKLREACTRLHVPTERSFSNG